MSLGWQCESALVPRKANPIKINDHGKSMMGLKSIIYNKEQNLQRNKELNAASSSSYAETRRRNIKDKVPINSKSSDNNSTNKESNKNIEVINDDPTINVYDSLQEKARVYEALKNGTKTNMDRILDDNCMVSFSHDNDDDDDDDSYIYRNSKNSNNFHLTESNTSISRSSTAVCNNIAPISTSNLKIASINTLHGTLQDSNPSLASTGQEFISRGSSHSFLAPNQARVKSQWEKNTHAKQYLESVHQDTIIGRAGIKLVSDPTDVIDSIGTFDSTNDTTNTTITGKSQRELRLEMLQKKQKILHEKKLGNNL